MDTHRTYVRQINDNVKVSFIYENNPVFAGTDEFSLLVKFQYVNDISDTTFKTSFQDPFSNSNTEVNIEEENEDENNSNNIDPKQPVEKSVEKVEDKSSEDKSTGGWFGSRLSTQLSNATRSLFLDSFNKDTNNETKLDEVEETKVTSLILGYGQILGHYTINDTIIDYSLFKELQKSTIIEGKFAGIHGLNSNIDNDDDGSNFLSGLNTLYNTEMSSPDINTATENHMKFIPFYSSNQNIIFSELEFDPNNNESLNEKSFYINCKLPKFLPPTYSTEAVNISYNFILGYQETEGKNIISKTIFVPFKIQPFIDNYGRQPIYHLQKSNLNMFTEDLVIEDISNHQLSSTLKNGNRNSVRRISFWNLKKRIESRRLSSSSSFHSTINSTYKSKLNMSNLSLSQPSVLEDEDIQDFLKILDSLDKSDVNSIIQIQEQFDKSMINKKSYKFNLRENLMEILSDYKYAQRQKDLVENLSDTFEYDHLLPREQQTKYIIKQNNDAIATILLKKAVFKLGDYININLNLENDRYETTGIEIQLLKHQIFYKDEYLKKGTYGEPSSRLDNNILESILFEKVLTTFNTFSVNTDVLVPIETESQFKTNFFTNKYYLQIRFITSDTYSNNKNDDSNTTDNELNTAMKTSYDLNQIFIDGNGSILFRARENISNVNEFYIRIPVIILPNYEQDFGLVTTKV